MTNKLREAALEALKELQQLRPQNQSPFWFRITEDLRAALAQPAASGEPLSGKWEGAEEWMPLAWELCADECGEEACTALVWEGGPVPEPWGDRWLKYEDEAKRLIALVRKHAPAAQPAPALVPLTDEQALEIAVTATPPGSMVSRSQIVEAIRLAERHHGIFPSKENPL